MITGDIGGDDHIDFNNDDISQVMKQTEFDIGSESEYHIMMPNNQPNSSRNTFNCTTNDLY